MLIKIKNLKLKTILGIHPWEKTINREIIINVEIETDRLRALETDEIIDTIDYDLIINKIKNLVATKKFNLIEKLAQEIINEIINDERIKKCKLEIDKIGIADSVESASITIEHNRFKRDLNLNE